MEGMASWAFAKSRRIRYLYVPDLLLNSEDPIQREIITTFVLLLWYFTACRRGRVLNGSFRIDRLPEELRLEDTDSRWGTRVER